MLFHVYAEAKPEGYFDPATEPFGMYRDLLDADWLLYLLLPMLGVMVVAILMLAWHIHELPKHKAEKKMMRQTELVSALTLLGLIEHWVWALALFLAYVDWNAMEDWLVKILRRARMDDDPLPESLTSTGSAAPSAMAAAAIPTLTTVVAAPVAAAVPSPAAGPEAQA